MEGLKTGITLIELLVAMALFVILSLFTTQSLFSILQSRNKTEIDKTVRAEADYAGAIIERHLRGALSATCTSQTTVSYTDVDGLPGSFSCVGTPQNSYIASGSAGLRLTSTAVSVNNCQFSCPTSARVDISFTITQAQTAVFTQDRSATVVSTQVILRNK